MRKNESTLIDMKNRLPPSDNQIGILQVIHFQGKLTPAAARGLLQFGFSEENHSRMATLSAKAHAGALTSAEQVELDTFERLGCVLDILHSEARQALNKKTRPRRVS